MKFKLDSHRMRITVETDEANVDALDDGPDPDPFVTLKMEEPDGTTFPVRKPLMPEEARRVAELLESAPVGSLVHLRTGEEPGLEFHEFFASADGRTFKIMADGVTVTVSPEDGSRVARALRDAADLLDVRRVMES